MAIITKQANPQPMTFTEWSLNICSATISIPEPESTIDFCFCNYDCDWVQLAFYGADDYQTDRSDFLVINPDNVAGSFEIFLINQSTGVQTQITDNTFGVFYPLGSFTTQPDKGGFLVNWGLVASGLGPGKYKVLIKNNYFGVTVEKLSHAFHVLPYSPKLSNGTVKLEATLNKCIQGGVDYTGMNWVTSVRFKGQFKELAPRVEVTRYDSATREQLNIQSKSVKRYQLQSKLIPSSVVNALKDDKLLQNQTFITDYNILSFEDLRQVAVVLDDWEGFDTFNGSRKGRFSITFEEKVQNRIARS